MLFDDDEQLEVRHVVSLAHHDVSIYSGGDVTPEGELFIKRNAICLSRRATAVELAPDSQVSKPFYLFSENCSAKEDFYFALLRNQEQAFSTEVQAPAPLAFDVRHMIGLVQKLHSSEEHMQSRWLNAMIGRIFLGLYRTADMEALIREKLNKKISRVKRPAFLSHIEIRKIDTGSSAPFFTNLRHKDLTVEGECCMEADLRYTGNFRIEVAAVARIDLGGRLKAREVNLVLSVALRKLEGHALFKIKAPPSNRIWFSFSQMPKMEMTIEPIVSSRQITYTVILRQIEARIKEVVAETIVLPFWDDNPFFRTEHKTWRGGIFAGDDAVQPSAESATLAAEAGEVDDVDTVDAGAGVGTVPNSDTLPLEKSHSMPVIEATQPTGLFGLKLGRGKQTPLTNPSSPTVDTHSFKEANPDASSTGIDIKKDTPVKQRPERSGSFVVEPTPIVSTETVNADVFKPSSPPGESPAISAMAKLSARTRNSPAPGSPLASTDKDSAFSTTSLQSLSSSKENTDTDASQDATPKLPRRGTASSTNSVKGEASTKGSPTPSINGSVRSQGGTLGRGLFMKREATSDSVSTMSTGNTNNTDSPRKISLAAVSNAAGVAKRWGWNALHRGEPGKNGQGSEAEIPEIDLSKPMGGGRPLPPPGMPLPMPDKKTKSTSIPVPKRKPMPPPNVADKVSPDAKDIEAKRRPVPAPPLPKRRLQTGEDDQAAHDEDVLVVAAPVADSEPTTPNTEDGAYRRPFVEDADDDSDRNYQTGDSFGNDGNNTPPALPARENQERHLFTTLDQQQREAADDDSKRKYQAGESLGNTSNKTPPALPARDNQERRLFGTSDQQQHDSADDDEFSAWMDNTGEEDPTPSYITSEGLAQ